MRPRLFTPGPTQIPEQVIAAMSQPMQHHRSPAFKNLFMEISTGLQELFKTGDPVLTLTASGTGTMESTMVSVFSRGDKIISIEGGKFGQRWGEMARAYGLEVVSVEVPWGQTADLDVVESTLKTHSDCAAVYLTHSETSTGVVFDVKAISSMVHRLTDALLVVDGITSIGVLPFLKDEWEIDIAVSGSQKGTMIPPGLGFAALNERAWRKAESSDLPKYYFSLLKARKALENSTTPFTPATTLLIGLQKSLSMILEEGLPYFWDKYARLAHATREGVQAVGLELFTKSPSNALTAVKIPEQLDGQGFVTRLREVYNVTVAGGQAQLKGKVFRVAHMGYYDHLDMVAFASAMEMALRDMGWTFELGKAVATVQRAYAENVSAV